MKNFKTLFIILSFMFFSIEGFTANCTWIGGDGNWSDSQNWSCGEIPDNNDNVTISSGTVVIDEVIKIRSLTIEGTPVLEGSGKLRIKNSFNINENADCIFDVKIVARPNCITTFENATLQVLEKMNLKGTSNTIGQVTIKLFSPIDNSNYGKLQIPSGAELTVDGDCLIDASDVSPYSFFLSGDIVKIGTGTFEVTGQFEMINADIDVQVGKCILKGNPNATTSNLEVPATPATIQGSTIDFATGTEFEFQRHCIIDNTTITGGEIDFIDLGNKFIRNNSTLDVDKINLPSGRIFFETGGNTTGADLEINQFVFENPPRFYVYTPILLNNVYVNIGSLRTFENGEVTITGDLDWESGNIIGQITCNGFTDMINYPELISRTGYFTIAGNGYSELNDKVFGTINIAENANLEINGQGSTDFQNVNVFGELIKTGDNFFLGGLYIGASGILRGNGTIESSNGTGNYFNDGIISPGEEDEIGALNLDFNTFNQTSFGKLDFQISENGNDLLSILGTANISGTLSVEELGNVPDGDYTILTAATIDGTFTTVDLPNANYEVLYNSSSVVIRKTTLEDDEDPYILCPVQYTVEIPTGNSEITFFPTLPTVSDNIGIASLEFKYAATNENGQVVGPFSEFLPSNSSITLTPGLYITLWRVTDLAGNTSLCVGRIVVVNTLPMTNGSESLSLSNSSMLYKIDKVILNEIDEEMEISSNEKPFQDLKSQEFQVFPNPTRGAFTINLEELKNIKYLKIMDINGRIKFQQQSNLKNSRLNIDTNNWANGIYFVICQTNDNLIKKKVIVQK